jgi:purine catabolism regulator
VVCVLDLVELDELALELVAGVDAAGRPLAGASVNEHADPTPWLRGGELLMMDGLELRRSKRHIDAYVDRIVAAGVAALAIGIGENLPFARVPRLLANACEVAGLPLVKVPSTTPFAQVSEAVFSRLTQERFGEAPMMVETQRALTRAAAKPASSPLVVATLARLTGLLVMLCDTEAGLLTASPDVAATPPGVVATIREMAPRGLHGTAMVPYGDGYLRIEPVGATSLRGFLAYGTEQGGISEFQGAAAGFAVWLLCIDLERQHVVRTLQRRPREEAAERLARGVTPAAAEQLLRSRGIHLDRVKVALAQPPPGDIADAVNRMADLLPEALVGRDRSAVLIIAPADLPDLAARLAAGAPAWPVGLGGPVQPHQCPISLRQAQRGVQLAQQRGGGVLDVMRLASARILLEGVPADMLRSYADATLRPVESADGGELLLRTLAGLAGGLRRGRLRRRGSRRAQAHAPAPAAAHRATHRPAPRQRPRPGGAVARVRGPRPRRHLGLTPSAPHSRVPQTARLPAISSDHQPRHASTQHAHARRRPWYPGQGSVAEHAWVRSKRCGRGGAGVECPCRLRQATS